MKANAVLCIDGWAGRCEQPVAVLKEYKQRVQILAVEDTNLAGRRRILKKGDTCLVPKRAIRMEDNPVLRTF